MQKIKIHIGRRVSTGRF